MKMPRKLLIVKREAPDFGWNVMLEIDGERTLSAQVPDSIGERVMSAAQDAVLNALVNSGFSAIRKKER
jgi:hypothetical protein